MIEAFVHFFKQGLRVMPFSEVEFMDIQLLPCEVSPTTVPKTNRVYVNSDIIALRQTNY